MPSLFFHESCHWAEEGMGRRGGGGPQTSPANDDSHEKRNVAKNVKAHVPAKYTCILIGSVFIIFVKYTIS